MSLVTDLVSGGIKGIFDSLTGVVHSLKADPTTTAQLLSDIEAKKVELIGRLAELDEKIIESVNQTMREEAKSEHWLQYSWRPMGAYIFYALIVNNFILVPYLSSHGIVPLAIPENVWLVFMALLGVTAWTRGQAQIAQIKSNGG